MGDGLYIRKGGCVCEVETDGKRILLELADGESFKKLGNGLYLRKEGKIYHGKGSVVGSAKSFQEHSNFRYDTL